MFEAACSAVREAGPTSRQARVHKEAADALERRLDELDVAIDAPQPS